MYWLFLTDTDITNSRPRLFCTWTSWCIETNFVTQGPTDCHDVGTEASLSKMHTAKNFDSLFIHVLQDLRYIKISIIKSSLTLFMGIESQ